MPSVNHAEETENALLSGHLDKAMFHALMAMQVDKSDWPVIRAAHIVETVLGVKCAVDLMAQNFSEHRKQNYKLAYGYYLCKCGLKTEAFDVIEYAFNSHQTKVNIKHLLSCCDLHLNDGNTEWPKKAVNLFAVEILSAPWSLKHLMSSIWRAGHFQSLADHILSIAIENWDKVAEDCQEELSSLSVFLHGNPLVLPKQLQSRRFIEEYREYYKLNTKEQCSVEADVMLQSDRRLDDKVLAQRIEAAIDEQAPFSFLRIGDGEGRFVGGLERFPEIEARSRSIAERIWFWNSGCFPPSDFFEQLQDAFQNADVVGINPRYRIELECMSSAIGYVGVTTGNKFIFSCKMPKICYNWSHVTLDNAGFFKELFAKCAQKKRVINIISPYEEIFHESSPFSRSGIHNIIKIPTDGSTLLRSRSVKQAHYPDRMIEVLNLISERKGEVFIVAAGVFAKIYCNTAKMSGNIALDVGSLLDVWMGNKTR